MNFFFLFFNLEMGNIESVDGQSEMKHHIMPLKVPMPDPSELEEKFAIVLVSFGDPLFFYCQVRGKKALSVLRRSRGSCFSFHRCQH